MTGRDRGPNRALLVIGAAALLGFTTVFARAKRLLPGKVSSYAQDEASGRGRPVRPAAAESRAAGYETADLRGGPLGKLLLLLGSVAVCMVFAMVGLRLWVTQVHKDSLPPLTRLQTTPVLPPKPNLQADAVDELARLRAREASQLYGYAYLDPAKTRARIPIDQAMTLTIGRDLGPPP